MPNPFPSGGKQRRPPNGLMIAKGFTMRLPMVAWNNRTLRPTRLRNGGEEKSSETNPGGLTLTHDAGQTNHGFLQIDESHSHENNTNLSAVAGHDRYLCTCLGRDSDG